MARKASRDCTLFAEILAALNRNFPEVRVAFIHGNHDADTYEHWEMRTTAVQLWRCTAGSGARRRRLLSGTRKTP